MAEQFSIPTVGDVIAGKYRVEQELGRGAYGVVFRAEQDDLERSVAVKTLLPQAFLQQDIVQRFQREAQLISRLDHPNIIRLWDYGVDEGLLYMAVEFVQGRTLMDVIENDAPLPPARVNQLALQILDALHHAHGHGIVHRDLKPENIVLLETATSEGDEYEVVKILDFGISKLLRGDGESGALKSLTRDGTVLGTPHYMSPENIVGDPIDHRADLYAFGVILYEMLTGTHPFDAPSPSAVMVRHLRDDAPPVPEPLRETALGLAIQRCLEKQPWDRIDSAAELIAMLEASDEELARMSRPPSGRRPSRPPVNLQLPDLEADATVVSKPHASRKPAPKLGASIVAAFAALALLGAVVVALNLRSDPGDDERAVTDGIAEAGELPSRLTAVTPRASEGSAPTARADAGNAVAAPPPDEDVADEVVFEADEVVAEEEPPRPPAEPTEPADEPRPDPRPDPQPTPPRVTPRAEAQASKEAEAVSIAVQFASEPSNASVTIDGAPIGSTPVSRTLPAGEPVEVRFSHIGYKEKTITVTPSADQPVVQARLEKDHLRLID